MAQSRIKAQASTAIQLDSACSCTETMYDSAKQSNLLLGAGGRGVSLQIRRPPLRGHVRAGLRPRSILSNSRPPASAAGPARLDNIGRLSWLILPIFFQSKFSIKFSSNFDAILPPTWPPKSSQNPSKIDLKSLLKV